MTQFMTLLLVSFLSVSALAQFDDREVPLPPPTGPGNGIPNTPPPPPGQRPPVDNPQYPPVDPGQPQTPPPATNIETPYTLGAAQTLSTDAAEFRFRPAFGFERLTKLQLVGIDKKVRIHSVVIVYANGMGSYQVPNFDGILREGESRGAFLPSQPVQEVIIVAGNSSFWRKAGGFRVDVTAITSQ